MLVVLCKKGHTTQHPGSMFKRDRFLSHPAIAKQNSGMLVKMRLDSDKANKQPRQKFHSYLFCPRCILK